jgi:serine/threonine protein kinase
MQYTRNEVKFNIEKANINEQHNQYDCGIFCCIYAACYLRSFKLSGSLAGRALVIEPWEAVIFRKKLALKLTKSASAARNARMILVKDDINSPSTGRSRSQDSDNALSAMYIPRGEFQSMGVIYDGFLTEITKASHQQLGVVALKRYRKSSSKIAIIDVSFLQEAKYVSKLSNHQFLIRLIGVTSSSLERSTVTSLDSLIFPFYERGNLYEFIESDTEILSDLNSVVRLCFQISDGLAHLHANGIVHCDMKSPNVLLDDNLEPKVITIYVLYKV